MKIRYMNDTNRSMHIHPATEMHGVVCDMSSIAPHEMRYFDIPDGSSPFLKLWDYTDHLVLLVSFSEEE